MEISTNNIGNRTNEVFRDNNNKLNESKDIILIQATHPDKLIQYMTKKNIPNPLYKNKVDIKI